MSTKQGESDIMRQREEKMAEMEIDREKKSYMREQEHKFRKEIKGIVFTGKKEMKQTEKDTKKKRERNREIKIQRDISPGRFILLKTQHSLLTVRRYIC